MFTSLSSPICVCVCVCVCAHVFTCVRAPIRGLWCVVMQRAEEERDEAAVRLDEALEQLKKQEQQGEKMRSTISGLRRTVCVCFPDRPLF